jgi:hypothetical protein
MSLISLFGDLAARLHSAEFLLHATHPEHPSAEKMLMPNVLTYLGWIARTPQVSSIIQGAHPPVQESQLGWIGSAPCAGKHLNVPPCHALPAESRADIRQPR